MRLRHVGQPLPLFGRPFNTPVGYLLFEMIAVNLFREGPGPVNPVQSDDPLVAVPWNLQRLETGVTTLIDLLTRVLLCDGVGSLPLTHAPTAER